MIINKRKTIYLLYNYHDVEKHLKIIEEQCNENEGMLSENC